MSAEQYQMARWEREIEERNRPLSDEELNSIIPAEGYRIMPEPPVHRVAVLLPSVPPSLVLDSNSPEMLHHSSNWSITTQGQVLLHRRSCATHLTMLLPI